MNNCNLYILTFCVTAVWDIILNYITDNYDLLPDIIKKQFPFIGYLIPYFKQHTLLAAALIAGFVGATTQMIIQQFIKFPYLPNKPLSVATFLVVSFIISALYGFVMKWSRLFPILNETYYKHLEADGGVVRSMYNDGISGLIVQISLLVLYSIFSSYK